MFKSEEKIARIIFITLGLIIFFAAIFTDGNGKVGDSITHYICAKFSWQQPILFFNHWGKPLFTVLASPFAQFGFTGIKLFNVISGLLAAFMAGETAKLIGLNRWFWVPLFVLGGSLYFPVLLSGLTEPFSALLLILSVYYWFKQKPNLALICLSFLPFVRSEGLIMILVIATFLVFTKQIKKLPWLLLGHLIYSLAGWYFYHDILWVFTKIPYASVNSVYGKGTWTHFLIQLYFSLGPLLYIGFIIGTIAGLRFWFDPKKKSLDSLFWIYGLCWAFIAAHSAFWALGIFNSMGLNRVLVTIFPSIGIIILIGLNESISYLKSTYQSYAWAICILVVIIFPFLNNPASINLKEATQLSEEQVFVRDQVAPYLQNKLKQQRCLGADPNFALYADINMFDEQVWIYSGLGDPIKKLRTGDWIIYDPWYFPTESGIQTEQLKLDSSLRQDTVLSITKSNGENYSYEIFQKK